MNGVLSRSKRVGNWQISLAGSPACYPNGAPCWIVEPGTGRIRDELIAAGRARPHHVLPDSGWVSKRIETEEDADEVIELFRLSYERARVAQAVRAAQAET